MKSKTEQLLAADSLVRDALVLLPGETIEKAAWRIVQAAREDSRLPVAEAILGAPGSPEERLLAAASLVKFEEL